MLHLLNNIIKFSIPGRNKVQFKAARDFSCPYHYRGAANPYLFSLTSVKRSVCYRTSQDVTHEAELVKNKVLSTHHCLCHSIGKMLAPDKCWPTIITAA